MKVNWLIIFCLVICVGCAGDRIQNETIEVFKDQPEIISIQLDIPWSISKVGRSLFITERKGTLLKVDEETKQIIPQELSLNKKIYHIGEGGLLGFTLTPDFETSKEAYIYHTYEENNEILNRVVLIERAGDVWVEQRSVLENIPGGRIHNGGRLKFGPDGYLYITTGDAGVPDNAQNLVNLSGKILRMERDGSIPSNNPFDNSYIYSYGHRNPQGLTWDGENNLYATEHGQSAHDEINLVRPGRNYGWPIIEGNEKSPGLETPLFQSGKDTWAPSGVDYYNGKLYVATLRGQSVRSFDLDTMEISIEYNQSGRMRDILIHDNTLYALTNNKDGRGSPQEDDDKLMKVNID
ncbi:PQQ-dependent sugar dehydrogenase [Bacillus luteolus]|uniref:PQQ-dependent sugar dehydrogenase n=1 Tax=Litchfieldia luteola TaxID=682179 RepID=A0ABR9QG30_9BACI|nr:PQQ-dependent sugar dehydrogenase [Cytobacillus luteolus]MBE4907449.1 PQQ-dependent sugar dehydrogenase [Cytobacillus luteolus]MBP1944216.1 glucose/arabinose dehydrogenase [Cytobacillus luteolus]